MSYTAFFTFCIFFVIIVIFNPVRTGKYKVTEVILQKKYSVKVECQAM